MIQILIILIQIKISIIAYVFNTSKMEDLNNKLVLRKEFRI